MVVCRFGAGDGGGRRPAMEVHCWRERDVWENERDVWENEMEMSGL